MEWMKQKNYLNQAVPGEGFGDRKDYVSRTEICCFAAAILSKVQSTVANSNSRRYPNYRSCPEQFETGSNHAKKMTPQLITEEAPAIFSSQASGLIDKAGASKGEKLNSKSNYRRSADSLSLHSQAQLHFSPPVFSSA